MILFFLLALPVGIYLGANFYVTWYRRMRDLISSDLGAVNFMIKYANHRKHSHGISEKEHELLDEVDDWARNRAGQVFFIGIVTLFWGLYLSSSLTDWLYKSGYINR
jgi:hypothetical protein